MPPSTTKSGIVTDAASGQRHIPASTRADGSTRQPIKIRPGYRPPEDVEVYKTQSSNTGALGKSAIPGSEDAPSEAQLLMSVPSKSRSASDAEVVRANSGQSGECELLSSHTESTCTEGTNSQTKKVRSLQKKLKQARELERRRDEGEILLPEQALKVLKITDLLSELQSLEVEDM